jgi:site-specific recombinase XerD
LFFHLIISHNQFENKLIKVEKIISLIDKQWVSVPPISKDYIREVPMNDSLVKILKKHNKRQLINKEVNGTKYNESPFVCTRAKGKLVTPRSMKYLSRVAAYELFIDLSFQSFRHSYAINLINSDMDLERIQYLLGYKSSKGLVEKYYDKVYKTTRSKLKRVLKSNSKFVSLSKE